MTEASLRSADSAIRRIDAAMALAALLNLALLVLEHGALVDPELHDPLRTIGFVSATLFALLQFAKLLLVPAPRDYFATHRIDFALMFVLALQLVVYASLAQTPEYQYLVRAGHPSPLWGFYVATLQAYAGLVLLARSPLVNRALLRIRLQPAQMMVASFALLVVGGAALLALPGSSRDLQPLAPIDALFTAASAVCVTGLVVVDTAAQFSTLGMTVVAVLIQLGGLGVLTFTAAFAAFGAAPAPRDESGAIAAAFDTASVESMHRLIRRIVTTTFACELLGAAALYVAWHGLLPDPLQRLGWAAFHAVSAFCNAGFALFAGNASLTGLAAPAATLLPIATLIVLGGLGADVLADLARAAAAALRGRRPTPLARHTRWVLVASTLLVVGGTLWFLAGERDGALRGLAPESAWLHAFFQSVTLRTAGFNSVPIGALAAPTVALAIVWMLVGGSPGSTAGGMKTTTVAVVGAGLLRRPRLPRDVVLRARRIAVAFLASYALLVALAALAQGDFGARLLFEVASGLATVGLTMDYTAELGTAGKLVLTLAMFVGRVGPLVVVEALVGAERRAAAGAGRGPAAPEDVADPIQVG